MPTSPINPEERKRIVDDALHKMRAKFEPEVLNDTQRIVNNAKEIHHKVIKLAQEVNAADLANGGVFDRNAMYSLLVRLYRDNFCTWSKDELIELNAAWHAEMALEALQ